MLSREITQYDTPASGQIAFLRRVTQDDQFRTRLEADPQSALAEYGLEIGARNLPAQVTLPRRDAMLEAIGDLAEDQDRDPRTRWIGFLGTD